MVSPAAEASFTVPYVYNLSRTHLYSLLFPLGQLLLEKKVGFIEPVELKGIYTLFLLFQPIEYIEKTLDHVHHHRDGLSFWHLLPRF